MPAARRSGGVRSLRGRGGRRPVHGTPRRPVGPHASTHPKVRFPLPSPTPSKAGRNPAPSPWHAGAALASCDARPQVPKAGAGARAQCRISGAARALPLCPRPWEVQSGDGGAGARTCPLPPSPRRRPPIGPAPAAGQAGRRCAPPPATAAPRGTRREIKRPRVIWLLHGARARFDSSAR